MNELITFKDGVAVVDTVTIADGVGYPHKNVIALCRKHLDDLKDFGRVEFIIQPFQTKGGPQSREVAILTEDQAILLMAFMQNNEIVRKFKVALVKAFRAVRDALVEAQNKVLAIPQTLPEALRLAADLAEKNQQLLEQAKIDTPKAEWCDRVTAANEHMTITQAAQVQRLPAPDRIHLCELRHSDAGTHQSRPSRFALRALHNVRRQSGRKAIHAHHKQGAQMALRKDGQRRADRTAARPI